VLDDSLVGTGVAELRVRLAADPVSVSGARRFVADGLSSWGLADLVDDLPLPLRIGARITRRRGGALPSPSGTPSKPSTAVSSSRSPTPARSRRRSSDCARLRHA